MYSSSQKQSSYLFIPRHDPSTLVDEYQGEFFDKVHSHTQRSCVKKPRAVRWVCHRTISGLLLDTQEDWDNVPTGRVIAQSYL